MSTSNPHEQILQLLITGGFLDPGKLKEARDIIGKCAPSASGSLETAAQAYAHNSPTKQMTIWDRERAAFLAGAYHERADESQMKRLYEWIMDENRKSATTFFTSGWLRNVAKEIEYRLAAKTESHQ